MNILNIIYSISLNTLRESLRNKVLYSLLVVAFVIIAVGGLLGTVTIGRTADIVKDFGLGSISIFVTLIAVFLGMDLLYKEIEKKTIFIILSKPVKREYFIIGKFLGISATLFIELVSISLLFFGFLSFFEKGINLSLITSIFLIYLEILIITATTLFFSSFSTPILNGIFTLSIFIIGHFTKELRNLGDMSKNPLLEKITTLAYYILPNLENFNIKNQVVNNITVDTNFILFSILYGVIYILLLLTFSIIIFNQRDIN